MKTQLHRAFTLVELLVVITILAIISVVAYQNFWWAVDKAVSWRKINDISTIETALQQYKVDTNTYPATDAYDASTNMFGYNSSTNATPSNTIKVTYNGEEVASIVSANGWWKIYGTGTWASGSTQRQIWAKWTISRNTLGKKYLSKDLYDPELGDIKVWSSKMIDKWIWRYIYATYKKNKGDGNWSSNFTGNNYNLAFTIKKNGSDKFVTKVVWDYDEESCNEDKANCPKNLIGLADETEENGDSDTPNHGVPYTVTDFKQ
jgi:prepilin-type N-terminal cleavage/methylation domain-containing protein